jgi:hypothetical protein
MSSGTTELLRRALLNVNRYALSKLYGGNPSSKFRAGLSNDGPRAASGEALALAASIATGAYDARLVGQALPRARAVATWLVASYARAHAAVTPGGWGAGNRPMPADLHEWQSPLWAAQFGTAGWLLWPYLSASDRYNVAAMVVNEADRILTVAPNYYARPDGHVLFPGDTKAEEDAWVGTILALASVMLPHHPHAGRWRRQEATYEIAAFSTAGDDTSEVVINGRPLRSWLAGWNVFPDGTVVNHGLNPHPDYMAQVSLSLSAATVDALAGRPMLRAALHNAALVYCSLLSRRFSSPPYASPGGTIYQSHSAQVYYPVADDWGTSLMAQFVLLDTQAAALGLTDAASEYLGLHAAALVAQQARASDGRTFQSPDEYRYVGREQWVGEQIGRAWLVEWAAANRRLYITDAAV